MAKSPKERMDAFDEVLDALKELAPHKKFGGITLAEYEAQVDRSRSDREDEIAKDIAHTASMNKRDATDEITAEMRKKIVNGIIGDENFGPNSTLYERCGYVREDDRKSGLTRKKNTDGDK